MRARLISPFAILPRLMIFTLQGRFHDAPLLGRTLSRRRRAAASACGALLILARRPAERPDLLLP